MEDIKPIHSPLGASSAERWMNCPGSVALLKVLHLAPSDEPEYRSEGIAAHELGAFCLINDHDTWEHIGNKFYNVEVTKEMADAVQVYLDTVRPAMKIEGAKRYIEYRISHPAHPSFYGTLDEGTVYNKTAEINDYKHGAGIAVEIEDNPQLMYYAYGFIREFPEVENLILRIIQPRITWLAPVREWKVSVAKVKQWAEEVLIPAMYIAELDGGDLDAGEWCRFCPAKLVCPLMNQLFGAAATTNPKQVIELTNNSLGRSYNYIQAVKFYIKALEDEIYNRLNRGGEVTGCKLVPKKANRVFKPEACAEAKEKFGDDAFTKPEMKTPAEIDKLGATGKLFTKEYAYTPQTGLTVAAADDPRIAVKVLTTSEAFSTALANMNA